jgi:hypothetical protein
MFCMTYSSHVLYLVQSTNYEVPHYTFLFALPNLPIVYNQIFLLAPFFGLHTAGIIMKATNSVQTCNEF